MSGLLPQKSPVDCPDPEPRVLDITAAETEAVFRALSSDTARTILAALHEEPATQSELAARTDVSIQNVGYHLDQLAAADLVAVVEQWRSEKGRAMDVYAPTDASLVLVAGDGATPRDAHDTPTDLPVGNTGLLSSD